jgi:thioredoxin reductase
MAEAAIEYRDETPVRDVAVDESGGRLEVRTEASEFLEADYLLFAIGRVPQIDFLAPSILKKEAMLRAEGRLYFAGDVQNGLLRQTAISVGDGLRAAMQIYHSLKEGST